MTTARSGAGPVQQIKNEGKKAAYSPLMDHLTRLGYAIKGVIYITIGVIALGAAMGKNSTPADQVGAITAIGKLPMGPLVLWVILIGLISYALWGIIRALLDPFHKGSDTKGLLERGGYLISGLTYASFAIPTYRLIQGLHGGSSGGQTTSLVARLMAMPGGRWIVGIVGVAIILGGAYQVYMGLSKKFEQRFKAYGLSADQARTANQLGRFGTIARGIVFALAGMFVTLAATSANPGRARGLDGALKFLGHQPYGLWILGVIAIGLMAFGIYSIVGAAWFGLKAPAKS
ncbi:MAG: DUF1206 domain-containing protein [Bacteroidota bacterium]